MTNIESAFDSITEDYFASSYEGHTWLVETQPLSTEMVSELMAIRYSYNTHEDPFDEV